MRFQSQGPQPIQSAEDVFCLRIVNDSALSAVLHPVRDTTGDAQKYRSHFAGLPTDKHLILNLRSAGTIPDLVLLSIITIANKVHANGRELFLVNSAPSFEESLRTKRVDRLLRVCNETEAIQEVGGLHQGDVPLQSAYLQSVFDRANVKGNVEGSSSRGRKARPARDEYIKISKTDKGVEIWTNAQMLDDGAEMTLPFLEVLSKYAGDSSATLNLSEVKFLGEVVINGMFNARQACVQSGHEFAIEGCAGQPKETLRSKRFLR